jgi:hypothetical protein
MSEFTIFPKFVRDKILGFISNNVRGLGNGRSRMVVNRGSVWGLWMVGFVRIFLVWVSDINRTSRFQTRFFFLHPIDVVSILSLQMQGCKGFRFTPTKHFNAESKWESAVVLIVESQFIPADSRC